mgnify:FL=1|tara:strand:+ start:235 stop:1023 length:789 start_codon:yes stop_codon:yes gene_type:complete
MKDIVLYEIDKRGLAEVKLNRPEKNNAYNSDMINELIDVFKKLDADKSVRVVTIRGNGKHFQAGADLEWLKSIGKLSSEKNYEISKNTAEAIRGLTLFPKPTISLIHGGCFGGGTGIAAASDIVLASKNSIFSISEARWGVMAGIIIPHLNKSINLRNVRRYALTCERFDAYEAKRIGLVHEVCEENEIEEKKNMIVEQLLLSEPKAVALTKRRSLIEAGLVLSDEKFHELVHEHSEKRMSAEAYEGLMSFTEKRNPNWYKQ